MKKIKLIVFVIIILAIIVISLSMLLDSKSSNNNQVDIYSDESKKADITINDNYFVGQINDFYINYNMYVGKTVSYEGYILYSANDEIGVVRNYLCCGTDSYPVGLECLNYTGEKFNENEWVKVTGKIITQQDEQGIFPSLTDVKIEKLSVRGQETVTQ